MQLTRPFCACRLDPKIIAQLELARQKANLVALKGTLSSQQASTGSLKLGVGLGPGTAAAAATSSGPNASRNAAELIAEKLNAKLGYSKSSSSLGGDGEADGNGSANAGTSNAADFIRRLVFFLPSPQTVSIDPSSLRCFFLAIDAML